MSSAAMVPNTPEPVVRCRVILVNDDHVIVQNIDATADQYRIPKSQCSTDKSIEFGDEIDCAVILECGSENPGLGSLRRGSHWLTMASSASNTDTGDFEFASVAAVARDAIHVRLASGMIARCTLSSGDRQHSVNTHVRVRIDKVNPWTNAVHVTLADEVETILRKYPVGTPLLVRPTLRLPRGIFATDGLVTGFIRRPTNRYIEESFDHIANSQEELRVVVAARHGSWLVFELDGIGKDDVFFRFVHEHQSGDIAIGIVQRKVAYGYFISVEGLTCLAHISHQSSDEQRRHLRHERADGTPVQVQIKSIDVVNKRVSLTVLDGGLH